MSENRFRITTNPKSKAVAFDEKQKKHYIGIDLEDLLNEQQATISQLEEEKGYWKNKAMTLLMQVRRLTPRMTDKEVIEFSKELDDE